MKKKTKCKTPGSYSPSCECAYCSRKRKQIAASWNIKNMRRRALNARKFPTNTDPSSRHLFIVADTLVSKRRGGTIEEMWGAEHVAQSIYAVVAALWRARTELARAGAA